MRFLNSKNSPLSLCLLVLLLLCVICLQYLTLPSPRQPLGVLPLSWNTAQSKGFVSSQELSESELSFSLLRGARNSIFFDSEYSSQRAREVYSLPFSLPQNEESRQSGMRVEIELAGTFEPGRAPVPKLEFLRPGEKAVISSFLIPLRSRPLTFPLAWTRYAFEISPQAMAAYASPVILKIDVPARPVGRSMLGVRGRLVASPSQTVRERVVEYFQENTLRRSLVAFCFFFGAVFSSLFLSLQALGERKWGKLGIVFFLLCFAEFFRAVAFFHWDEWPVLFRFQELGFSQMFQRHNEHVLPLFFGLYYLESEIFGAWYQAFLLTNCLVHVLNALLVVRIFQTLVREERQQVLSIVCGLGYLVWSLHTESVTWAFELCLLLNESLLLWAVYRILTLESDKLPGWRLLSEIFFLTAAAPLVFGNGFVFPAVVVLFVLFAQINHSSSGLSGSSGPVLDVKRTVQKLALFALASTLGLAIPAGCYVLFQNGAGHGVAQANMFGDIRELLTYLWVGTQAGTILRGFGLLPNLGLDVVNAVTPGVFFSGVRPEVSLAIWGTGISVTLLILGGIRRSWHFWILGVLYLLLLLSLPALGRWSFGVHQSLALRYHSPMALGFLFMIFPVLRRYWGRGMQFLIFVWLSWQATLGFQYRFFEESGWSARRLLLEAEKGGRGELIAASPDPIVPEISLEAAENVLKCLSRK